MSWFEICADCGGRGVAVTRDVMPGELLAVSNPMVVIEASKNETRMDVSTGNTV